MRPTGDIHREVLRRDDGQFAENRPVWYAIWLGRPHAEGSVRIGRTERLPTPRYWRAHPETGEWPERVRGWSAAIAFLKQVHDGHQ